MLFWGGCHLGNSGISAVEQLHGADVFVLVPLLILELRAVEICGPEAAGNE